MDVGLDERFYVAIELQYHDQGDGMQLVSPVEWTTPLCKKKWGLKPAAGVALLSPVPGRREQVAAREHSSDYHHDIGGGAPHRTAHEGVGHGA